MPNIYLEDDLYSRLSVRAKQLNIPVNQLATDILSSVDLSRNLVSPQSFQFLYQDLRNRVDEFVRTAANGVEFSLRTIADWDGTINQSSYSEFKTVTPNGRRAALGRLFLEDVSARKVSHVKVAMRKNRSGELVKRLDKYGVVIYEVDKNGIDNNKEAL